MNSGAKMSGINIDEYILFNLSPIYLYINALFTKIIPRLRP
jgi:hypothetical protein